MALKTLQKNYDALLKAFEEAGVTLTESQKSSLDTFMLDFQKKLTETRDSAIKATKKLVEEKMEKEFKEVFESIQANQKKVFEKSSKIDVLRSQKVMTEALDQYLDKYVEEVLPKKTIVDYARMQKLETLHESLKGMLLVNEDAVEKKVDEVKSEYEQKMTNESKELKDKIEAQEKVIKESQTATADLKKKYAALLKKSLISEKTKNLPIAESKRMQERLGKMTVEEIQKNYKTVLESVQEEIKDEQDKAQEEKNLEEAITDLLEGKGDSDKTGDNADKGTENNADNAEGDNAATDDGNTEDDEPVEESQVVVTESMMQSWIASLERLTPKN